MSLRTSAPRAGASASSATRRSLVGQAGLEPAMPLARRPILSRMREPISPLPVLAEAEGLEPPTVLPATVFETARPAYSPHFRASFRARRGESIRGIYEGGIIRGARTNSSATRVANYIAVAGMRVASAYSCRGPGDRSSPEMSGRFVRPCPAIENDSTTGQRLTVSDRGRDRLRDRPRPTRGDRVLGLARVPPVRLVERLIDRAALSEQRLDERRTELDSPARRRTRLPSSTPLASSEFRVGQSLRQSCSFPHRYFVSISPGASPRCAARSSANVASAAVIVF
jgi:hypothetical protein